MNNKRNQMPIWLFVIPWYLEYPGGVNQVVLNLYKQCLENGQYQPRILILDWSARTPKIRRSAGLPVCTWRLRSPCDMEGSIKSLFAFLVWLPLALLRLRRLIGRNHMSVINLHYPGESAILFALAKFLHLYRGRLLLSWHGLDVQDLDSVSGCRRTIRLFCLRYSEALVACSKALANRLGTISGISKDNIAVVYNGVATEDIATPARRQRMHRVVKLLNVATFEQKKGQDILLQATEELLGEGVPIQVTFVGRSGPALKPLRDLAKSLNISGAVRFETDVPHEMIGEYYSMADIFVLPSREEPFGIVLLEAGLAGLPVVATRVGGIPEIIKHGSDGLLVNPDDSTELASAIRSLIEQPEISHEIAIRLRLKVAANFSWHHAFEEYVKLAKISLTR